MCVHAHICARCVYFSLYRDQYRYTLSIYIYIYICIYNTVYTHVFSQHLHTCICTYWHKCIYIYMYYMYYMHIMCNWMRRLTAVEIWIRLHLRNCTECKLHKKLNGGGNQPHCNAWAKPKRCAYVYICVCSHLFLKTHCTWLGVVYQIDLSCQPRINKQNTRLPNGASGYSLYWRS